jgi:hypothetical protein
MEATVYWLERVSIKDDVSHHAYILIYTISVESQPTMKVNIHNQCLYFRLINRKDFSNSMSWNKYPDVEIDTDSMMNADLTSSWAEFEGGLMYQLKRKRIRSVGQPDLTFTLLFIAWKSYGYKTFHVFVQLMECDRTFRWDKIKQKEYYQRYASQLCTYTGPIKDTWLLDDGTVMMTKLKLDFTQRDGVLNVTISEGVRDEHTKRSVWINPER